MAVAGRQPATRSLRRARHCARGGARMNTGSLRDALRDADLIHDRAHLESAIRSMGKGIDSALAGEVPIYLSVMHGGLIFSGALALAISNDLEFDYVHATRYRGG